MFFVFFGIFISSLSLALAVVLSLCLSLNAVGWFVVRFVSLACMQACVRGCGCGYERVCLPHTNLQFTLWNQFGIWVSFAQQRSQLLLYMYKRPMYGEFEKAFMASETQRKYGWCKCMSISLYPCTWCVPIMNLHYVRCVWKFSFEWETGEARMRQKSNNQTE